MEASNQGILPDISTRAASGLEKDKAIPHLSVRSSLGDVENITSSVSAFQKAKVYFSENESFQTAKGFFSENRAAFISLANNVAKAVNTFFNEIEAISDISEGGLAFSEFASILTLPQLVKKIKAIPLSFKNARTISNKAKVILEMIGLAGKAISIPEKMTKGLRLAARLWSFTLPVGAPLLVNILSYVGSVSLVLSAGLAAVKAWDLKGNFHFANKVRDRCFQNVMIDMENRLTAKITDKNLREKLEKAIEVSKKTAEKALYKSIQNELNTTPLNDEKLDGLFKELEKLNPNHSLKHQRLIFNDLKNLKNPAFKKDCENAGTKILTEMENQFKELLINSAKEGKINAKRELKELIKKNSKIDFQKLQKDLEKALSKGDQGFLMEIDRASRSQYLKIVSNYNSKKLGKVFAIDAKNLQGSVKKVHAQIETLEKQGKLYEADEMLTAHYAILKGRIKERKESEGWGLTFEIGGMFSSAVALSVLFGALQVAGAVSTFGISIGVTAAVLGILIIYKKYKSSVKFEEEMGIKESQLKLKWGEKLGKINQSYIGKLKDEEAERFKQINHSIAEGIANNQLFKRFKVPLKSESSPDEIAAAKQLNKLVFEMNKWKLKQPRIQKGILLKRQQEVLNHEMSKIHRIATRGNKKEYFATLRKFVRA